MKKLALFLFAVLILGCGNENPLLEENKALIEQNKTLTEQNKALAAFVSSVPSMNTAAPQITQGNVIDGYVTDADALNQDGIWFGFTEPIAISQIDLRLKDGTTLNWITKWNVFTQKQVTLTPPHACATLMNGSTYVIDIMVRDYHCRANNISMTFSTMPKPEKAAIALSIAEPEITAGSVLDGDADADPNVLNQDGILYAFSEPIAVSQIDLRLKDGPTLNWIVQWSADQQTVTLMSPSPCATLMNDSTYVIDMSVRDYGCWGAEFSITFATKQ